MMVVPPVSINSFDYISSVLSYALVGIPVFLGNYDHYTPAALSAVISEVRGRGSNGEREGQQW